MFDGVLTETTLHRCSYKKMFWKYAANSQNTNAKAYNFNKKILPVVFFQEFCENFKSNSFWNINHLKKKNVRSKICSQYRAYCSSLLRAIIAHNHLLFFLNILKFCMFLPKFSNILPFSAFLLPFFSLHVCPYFLE